MKTLLNFDKKTIATKKGIKEKDMKPLVAITGVSFGIGEVTVRIFSDNGYPLLLMAQRIEKLRALSLPNSVCKRVDVTKVEESHSILAGRGRTCASL